MLTEPSLSLYIHFPWCVRKCPYCDFNSHEANTSSQGSQIPEADYIRCLLADFENDQAYWQGRTIKSIFMGGGTPSLFSAEALHELLTLLRSKTTFSDDIEITLEANPGTFEQEKFRGYRQAGINRISLGIQSFNDQHLQRLGRIHSSKEAVNAIESLQSAGFENFNIDLMHGLPEQTLTQALKDLRTALALQPSHISWYQLTIEPNTVFYSKPPTLPGDDSLWQIQNEGQALLAENNFEQYEVSAYCKNQRQSKHNLNYWQFGDYLALGAGAHGKITDSAQNTIFRYQKTRLPKDYLDTDRPYTAQQHQVAREDLAFEFFMNCFRLKSGAEKATFPSHTGLNAELITPVLNEAIERGLVKETKSHWVPTEKGHLYLNDLLQLFL